MGPPSGSSKSSLGLELKFSNVEGKLLNVESKVESLIAEVRGVSKSLKFFSDSFDEIKEELKRVTGVQIELKKENVDLRAQLANVVRELDGIRKQVDVGGRERASCGLELYPIAFRENEDLNIVVAKVAEVAGYPLQKNQVEKVYRRKASRPDAPGPIVIKCCSLDVRMDLFKKIKERRIKAADLGFGGGEDRVYANEELTPMGRRLLFKAQQFRREHGYRFVWVKDGMVFLRKGSNDKCFLISCDADLNKLM